VDTYETEIEAAFLTHCSPQAAYEWLREHQPPDDDGHRDSQALESLLLGRKDRLIDLGIARFGRTPEAVKLVMKRGGDGVRCAALANRAFTHEPRSISRTLLTPDEIKAIVAGGISPELEALVKHPRLGENQITHLLERREGFADVPDRQYAVMLVWLSENPTMATARDERMRHPEAEIERRRIFECAWELARTLPTEELYAEALSCLLMGTHLPTGYVKAEEVIARWRLETQATSRRYKYHSHFLRSRLADTLPPNDQLLNSGDLAVRESFYRRFDPGRYAQWATFVERDGEAAFQAMIRNEQLWRSQALRAGLKDAAWKVPDKYSDMNAPILFEMVEDRYRKERPQWFWDEDDEYSAEPDAAIRRLEAKVDGLAVSVERLMGWQEEATAEREHADPVAELQGVLGRIEERLDAIESTRSLEPRAFDRLGATCEAISGHLRQIVDAVSRGARDASLAETRVPVVPRWVWIVGIIIAALFLLRR
jgi:hypothetical protein